MAARGFRPRSIAELCDAVPNNGRGPLPPDAPNPVMPPIGPVPPPGPVDPVMPQPPAMPPAPAVPAYHLPCGCHGQKRRENPDTLVLLKWTGILVVLIALMDVLITNGWDSITWFEWLPLPAMEVADTLLERLPIACEVLVGVFSLVFLYVYVPRLVWEMREKLGSVAKRRGFHALHACLVRGLKWNECLTCALTRLSLEVNVTPDVLAITQSVLLAVPRTVANLQSTRHILMAKLKAHCAGATELQLLDTYVRAMKVIGESAPAETSLLEVYGGDAFRTQSALLNTFYREGTSGETHLPVR